MTPQADRNERSYWRTKGWDPDLQEQRLDELAELAVRRPWDISRRQQFSSRAAELAAEQDDAARLDLTRRILAQEQVIDLPPDTQGVTVIAAYNSTSAIRQDFNLVPTTDPLAAQAWLLTRRMAMPDRKDPADVLRAAIELSRDGEFRKKRADLFDWQLARHDKPERAVERIQELANTYNEHVRAAVRTVRYKLAFTVFGVALGFATGGVVAGAAAAALSLAQFSLLDGKPAISPGNSQAAAMFHDIQRRTGLSLPSTGRNAKAKAK